MTRQQRLRVELHAVLALGSNLGDREQTIRAAVRRIDDLPGVTVVAASGLFETPALKPHGVDAEAPAYLNAVVSVRTSVAPDDLLSALNAIEHSLGRVREERWGDRTLDIDIIEFSGLRVDSDRLTIPHPRAAERAFVLVPWLEIDPNASLSPLGRIDQLPAADRSQVRPFEARPLL